MISNRKHTHTHHTHDLFPSARRISVPALPSLDGCCALDRASFLIRFEAADASLKGAFIKLRSVSIDQVERTLLSFEVHSSGGSRRAGDGATREDLDGEDPRRRGCGGLLLKWGERLHPPRRKGWEGGVRIHVTRKKEEA